MFVFTFVFVFLIHLLAHTAHRNARTRFDRVVPITSLVVDGARSSAHLQRGMPRKKKVAQLQARHAKAQTHTGCLRARARASGTMNTREEECRGRKGSEG